MPDYLLHARTSQGEEIDALVRLQHCMYLTISFDMADNNVRFHSFMHSILAGHDVIFHSASGSPHITLKHFSALHVGQRHLPDIGGLGTFT